MPSQNYRQRSRQHKSRRQENALHVAESYAQRPLGGRFASSSSRNQWQRRRQRQRIFRLGIVITALLAAITVIVMGLYWLVAQASVLLLDEATSPPPVAMDSAYDVNALQTPALYTPPFTYNAGRFMPILPINEDTALKAQLQAVFNTYDTGRFVPHVFYYDLSTGRYAEIGGYEPVSAASVIKLPLLWLLFEDMDAGYLDRYDPMLYLEYHRTGGAGTLQFRDANIAIPTYDVAKQMIQISDNTSTNMILDQLGGAAKVNQRLAARGLSGTWISNWLPDLEGTNHVSMYDLSTIYYNLYMGGMLSGSSRNDMLTILSGTHNKRLIPALLPEETLIYHKTGDIGSALADAAIVQLPDGRAYILAIQVDRPYNDYTARDIIQKASSVTYQHALAQPLI